MDIDDVPLTHVHEDVTLHFPNDQCASRSVGCSDVARTIRSPIKMVIAITETVVVCCERKQMSLNVLWACCFAIELITTQRPEYTVLIQKLKTRCNSLRPLPNCDELGTILCGVETLGTQSLR